jgi:hypothetical protein
MAARETRRERIVQNIIRRLIRLVIPTGQELIEAGIYLDSPHI